MKTSSPHDGQLTTFYVGSELFGIEVMQVQEVTGAPHVVPVPRAPEFIEGLVNLRGQVATALGLRKLLGIQGECATPMSVVCKLDGHLISILVDSIGDVVEVKGTEFEAPPETMSARIRSYLKGIYKMEHGLLSVLDLSKLSSELSHGGESAPGTNHRKEGLQS